jgi:hypothetical protein
MLDIVPRAGESRASVIARAESIRSGLEPQISSAEQLAGGTPAASPAAPPDTSYNPRLDPAHFGVAENAWFPLVPGTTWRYRGTGENAAETNVVTVTSDTRMILGIRATVVRDQVFENGELTEDTRDWYAIDREGNVWYLGEDTKEYRNGEVVSTAGSWEAGVNGAKPGIIMWADPAAHVGETYRQEYSYGVAEDMGRIVGLNVRVTVPQGTFADCIRTEDTTPLEPNVREFKFYCRGVGVVREMDSETAGMELVALEKR